MIRLATPDDLPALSALAAAMLEESPLLAEVAPFDEATFRANVRPLLDGGQPGGVLVHQEPDGQILGALVFFFAPVHVATRAVAAVEAGFSVRPGSRRAGIARALIQAMEQHARIVGAPLAMVGDGHGGNPEATDALLSGLGYRATGKSWRKLL